MPSQILRDYQVRSFEDLRDGFRKNLRRQILIAPTGSGKTTVAAHMIAGAVARGRRVLFVAHRKELIEQASARLFEHGVDHGIIMADHPLKRSDLGVQVASIQTLVRRPKWPEVELVVIDEAHHAAADSYERLFTQYPNAWVIGLTATPWRIDGRGLDELFDGIVVASTPKDLIKQGHLCDYGGFRYAEPDLSGVRTIAGDYEQHGLTAACSKVVGDVVGQWLARAAHMKTILFGVNIEHSRVLAAAFGASGVRVDTIDHTISKPEREATLARVRSGETRIICNVGILGEGVDIPDLECAVLARPTKSLSLYLQQVGRVMRPFPGKPRATIHDHAGLIRRHGLPDDSRDYSLQSSKETQPKGEAIRTCPKCFACFRTAPECPECGYLFPIKKRELVEVEGVAVDIRAGRDRGADKSEMDQFKRELIAEARRRGYKPGWAVRRFLEKYPNAPKPWGMYRELSNG